MSVEQDIISYQQENGYPEESISFFCFNNWPGKLPGGALRILFGSTTAHEISPGRWQGNTLGEYFTHIDQALAASHIDPEMIKLLQQRMRDTDNVTEKGRIRTEIIRESFPAIVLLRQQGYTHIDIAG